jgi:hypothetical protein
LGFLKKVNLFQILHVYPKVRRTIIIRRTAYGQPILPEPEIAGRAPPVKFILTRCKGNMGWACRKVQAAGRINARLLLHVSSASAKGEP